MPKAELVYYTDEQEVNAERMRLAYKLDLYAQEPVGRRVYFVDAETGAILGQREIMHNVNATGTAVTGYSGSQSITTDSYTGGYRLQETGRGNGIQTLNLNRGTSYSTATDFTDADNYWNNANTNLDQYATDAHWGAEKTYDYYKNTYNRNSIDNAGFAIRSYVHYSTNYFNAFWDGSRMTYGDGSSYDNYQPLTAIDVCGHEITHGLTAFTANLNYSYESGALNEGFSDIFGTVIEFYAKPTAGNWLIGEAFYTLRSMSNPNTYGQPDTYRGTNWANGTSDYGGVHTNSGVLNFWFYLLSQGGSGTNDNSVAYSVTGIGITKAAAIAYRTLTVYLTSTSQYANARTWSIQAAADLYGAASNEVIQTINAWNAVGVVDAQCPANLTITANVTAPNADYKQASGAITALNTITSGATAIYHAGNEVVLSPGFEAVNGSSFKAYIESCSGNYQIQPSAPETITYNIRPGDIKSTGAKPALTTNTLVVSPNPFTGKLAISYYLATNNRKAAIEVYSVTGAKVADLLQDGQAAGSTHRVEWNADSFPGGMYLVVLTTDTGKEVRRVVKKQSAVHGPFAIIRIKPAPYIGRPQCDEHCGLLRRYYSGRAPVAFLVPCLCTA